jgi:serine/threonine protein kinase
MTCPKCGSQNPESTRFCINCGTQVLPTRPAPVAATFPEVEAAQPDGTDDALIGRTPEGKYRIEAKLGAGGMGAVYRATRLLIGDTVALKMLHPEQVAAPQMAERFRREAQAAARLKHPNAVTIYDFGVSAEGLLYLVMELAEGESLRQMIEQQGAIAPETAAEIINQVCAALDEAHRQHIVHRDLKPDNVIVATTSRGWRVKVLDFGIAKLRDVSAGLGTLTQTGAVMGTPQYMSPEQCLGEELDSRSDIYSLGVMLYEMLTGTLPFNSPSMRAILAQQINQAPPPLRAINTSISPEVEAVVLHALQKEREARPQTAIELAHELSEAVKAPSVSAVAPIVLETTPIKSSDTAPPAGPTQRYTEAAPTEPPITRQAVPAASARRYLIPLVLIAAAVALTGLLAVGYFLFLRDRTRQDTANTVPTPVLSGAPSPTIAASVSATPALTPAPSPVDIGISPSQAYTPPRGSAERQTIMDALREDVRQRTGVEATFTANYLKVNQGWAWIEASYSDRDLVVALLCNQSGGWKVIARPEGQSFDQLRANFPEAPADIFPDHLRHSINPARPQSAALSITATASSTRPQFRGISYAPGNALDGSMMTAWIEGAAGHGIGEWIRCDFEREVTLRRILIAPGYFKSPEIWAKNCRVAAATVHFSDGSSRQFRLADRMEEQKLEVGRVRTRWVRIVIDEVYPGTDPDTAISQLTFDWEP